MKKIAISAPQLKVLAGEISVPEKAFTAVWDWVYPFVQRVISAKKARRLAVKISNLSHRKDSTTDENMVRQIRDMKEKHAELVRDALGAGKELWKLADKTFDMIPMLVGWRYSPVIERASAENRKNAYEDFGRISVWIERSDEPESYGYWNPTEGDGTINLHISFSNPDLESVRELIQHELTHWVQSYMSAVLGAEEKFGLPPKAVRTPEYRQSPTEEQKWEMGMGNVDDSVFHAMDDTEFHPSAESVATRIKNFLSRIPTEKRKTALEELLGVSTGRQEAEPMAYLVNLKELAPGKWRLFVNEVLKKLRQ
jgi:hypothetical protein